MKMTESKIEPGATTEAEAQREWDGFCLRVRIETDREIWNKGLFVFKALRIALPVAGAVLFACCAWPFLAGIGRSMSIGAQIFCDIGLAISAGAILAPVWLKGRIDAMQEEVAKLDSAERTLGTAGLKTFEAARRSASMEQ